MFGEKFIRIPMNQVIIKDDFTTYAKGFNKENESVYGKILTELNNMEGIIKKNPMEDPINYSIKVLRYCCIESCEEYLVNCKKLLAIERKSTTEHREIRARQKANYLQEEQYNNYVNTLSKQDRIYLKIKELLEEQYKVYYTTSNYTLSKTITDNLIPYNDDETKSEI